MASFIMLFPYMHNAHSMETEVVRCKVVIVGAGMAGLGAAYAFKKSGFTDFLIVDAMDEPGGRIKTIQLENGVLELGAQWMHDVDNTLYELAVENDLLHEKNVDEAQGLYVRDDGRVLDDWLVKRVDFRVGQILEECENFVDAEIYPKSVGEFLEKRFTEFVDQWEGVDDEKEILWELYDWHVRFQLIDNSCTDLKELSAREWGRYSSLGKDGQAHINLKGGFQLLVDLLVNQLPNNTLKLNLPVVRISINVENYVELKCTGGITIIAEHLILTPSLSVLKNQPDLISFPLPKNINSAIENMGFSGMGKVFLKFVKPWWNTTGYQLIFRRKCEYSKWTKFISGFDSVLDQPNVLLAWVAAKGAEEMEKLADDTIAEDCVDLLRKFLGNESIPYPVKIYKSNWISCEWVRGGYSHTTPKCDVEGVGAETLTHPVYFHGIPRVAFAGEAAHPTHFSTTHGAFESGEGQAQKILDYIQNK